MSGGRWGYQAHRLDETAIEVSTLIEMIARVEHHLDWGSCGDTCYGCAKERAVAIVEAYFDEKYAHYEPDQMDWRQVDKAPYPYPCEHR